MSETERVYREVVEAVVRPCGCVIRRRDDCDGLAEVLGPRHGGVRERLYAFGSKEEFLLGRPDGTSVTCGSSAFNSAKTYLNLTERDALYEKTRTYLEKMAVLAGCRSLEEIEVRLAAIG